MERKLIAFKINKNSFSKSLAACNNDNVKNMLNQQQQQQINMQLFPLSAKSGRIIPP